VPSIRVKRGTRAQLDAAALANGLQSGETYLITDESRLAVGTSSNAYQAAAKQGEGGSGGGAQIVSATITVPWRVGGGQMDWRQIIPVAGVTASSKISAAFSARPDIDDNDVEETEKILVSASYSSDGQVRIDASFSAPVTGQINLMLMVM
jgi:hypothetical protein